MNDDFFDLDARRPMEMEIPDYIERIFPADIESELGTFCQDNKKFLRKFEYKKPVTNHTRWV